MVKEELWILSFQSVRADSLNECWSQRPILKLNVPIVEEMLSSKYQNLAFEMQ